MEILLQIATSSSCQLKTTSRYFHTRSLSCLTSNIWYHLQLKIKVEHIWWNYQNHSIFWSFLNETAKFGSILWWNLLWRNWELVKDQICTSTYYLKLNLCTYICNMHSKSLLLVGCLGIWYVFNWIGVLSSF